MNRLLAVAVVWTLSLGSLPGCGGAGEASQFEGDSDVFDEDVAAMSGDEGTSSTDHGGTTMQREASFGAAEVRDDPFRSNPRLTMARMHERRADSPTWCAPCQKPDDEHRIHPPTAAVPAPTSLFSVVTTTGVIE
jgi:hypothetical protein